LSISKFFSELVEDHITAKTIGSARKDLEQKIFALEDQNKQLRVENTKLSKQVDMLNVLTDRYEDEIKQLKHKNFLNNDTFNGVREYERKLIDLLKQKRNIKEHDILDLLHVSPNDSVTIKAINRQIETLLDYGVIKMYKGGYQWLR
jgi:regulator of replication initiation timing